MAPNNGNGDWIEYRRLVIATLDQLKQESDERDRRLNKLENAVTYLKARSAGIGAATGGGVVAIAEIAKMLLGG